MNFIYDNLNKVEENISKAALRAGRKREDITLVAVTKTHGADLINEAIRLGITDIGENKVQEIMQKYDSVSRANWHLIGHLQTNKVKYIVGKVKLIHSVDSIKLMDEIERQGHKHNRVTEVLIQVNISGEETKFGIRPEEIETYLEYVGKLSFVKISGLMTILPKVDESVSNRLHFRNINRIYVDIQSKKYDNVSMRYLSMGMSGDYEAAIEEGSNMVRVGSAIFGDRYYN
ncbi:MAG: YggS family pyridoxal phosphate-dependent enzyme [Clostridia bacterium]|nr:YggS family pyridoxal phosphate-dependent enzyme [Clostridia bacterium]